MAVEKRKLDRKWTRLGKQATALLNGDDKVEDWDDEELRRGQRRDKNGKFGGRPPVLVPNAAHRELLKRRLREAEQCMVDALPAAAKTLVAIMESPFSRDQDRIKAAELLIERVMGKAIERVDLGISVEPPWMEALKAGIVDIDLVDDDEIIDAEVIEESDIDWDEDA